MTDEECLEQLEQGVARYAPRIPRYVMAVMINIPLTIIAWRLHWWPWVTIPLTIAAVIACLSLLMMLVAYAGSMRMIHMIRRRQGERRA